MLKIRDEVDLKELAKKYNLKEERRYNTRTGELENISYIYNDEYVFIDNDRIICNRIYEWMATINYKWIYGAISDDAYNTIETLLFNLINDGVVEILKRGDIK